MTTTQRRPPDTRIYCDLDRKHRDDSKYAILRVSVSRDFAHIPRIHIREWTPTTRDPELIIPGRGIALKLEELDAVIYSLALVREDVKKGLYHTP